MENENEINDDNLIGQVEDNPPQIETKGINKAKLILIISTILLLIIVIIIIVLIINKKNENEEEIPEIPQYPEIKYEISTVNFPSDIKYLGSHYNYQGQLLVIYNKTSSSNTYVGLANEEGQILKEIYEIKDSDGLDQTYIHRASSFNDGKRALIGGKILQCSELFINCNDAKIYDLVFPEELNKIKNLLYKFSEPIINYGGKYIFWSSFDKEVNTINFVGKLNFRDDNKYYIEDVKGISNYFYDLYNKETGSYTLPKILKFGPIKQVVDGGRGISIGGFLRYGLRKGIYQSLSEDEVSQLTLFEGYDETTSISPDLNLACVMTTRFSEKTSLEIVGLIPTPYSILASYLFSFNYQKVDIGHLRKDPNAEGNLGPALVYLERSKKEKDYKGYNLATDQNWIFHGFISWSPDNKKIMFDEINREGKRRCQIVKLTNYSPKKIEFKDNYVGNASYFRTIEETIDLHLDVPKKINVNGATGNLNIYKEENKIELTYNNYSEDNKIFYDGTYKYENKEKYATFEVDIKSTGEKKGQCLYRIWVDTVKNVYLYDKAEDGNNKTYGECEYEGRKINVDIYNNIKH